ncbi:hypothetical protein [Bacillus sp. Marseille-P3661]|uniref:hypothetical protein n=1 Tax=Bacillus sp. Marseille-P3661 TaxID=1936234 RepID=UPI000C820F1F|nr:hypothetical protein [Bacillus sp. Marseille-P3661]
MYIFNSSPRLANIITVILFALLFSGALQNIKQNSINDEFLIVSSLSLIGFLSYIIYIHSLRVIIKNGTITYQTLFQRKSVDIHSIKSIEFQHTHLSVDTMFPFLHINTEKEKLEIPMMMFEKDIKNIKRLLDERQQQ